RDIAPLRESVAMFVRFIAMVFAAQRLFPKDHPAMNDMTQRLTLREVIATAYSNVTFTREALPQTIMFFAVVGILAFSALFVVLFLMSLFMGTAHAQVFQAPSPATDWGLNVIDYLFKGKEITLGTAAAAQPDCGMMTALGAALSFYSKAVLVIAGLLLLYHLTFMIAETAHTGKAMGKANQIWAPIRLVLAIGLLVPIASGAASPTSGATTCNVTGYNTGQYLAMQVARWGSGMASQVWNIFSTNLKHGSVGCDPKFPNAPSCTKGIPDVSGVVRGLAEAAACEAILYKYMGDVKGSMEVIPAFGSPYLITSITDVVFGDPGEHLLGLTGGEFWNFNSGISKRVCGVVVVPLPGETVYAEVAKTQAAVFARHAEDIKLFGKNYGLQAVKSSGLTVDPDATRQAKWAALVKAVQDDLTTTMTTALATADAKSNEDLVKVFDKAGNAGWLMAGTWFGALSRFHSYRVDSTSNAMPSIKRPSLLEDDEVAAMGGSKWFQNNDLQSVFKSSAEALENYNNTMQHAEDVNLTATKLAATSLKEAPSSPDWLAIFRGGALNAVLLLVDKAGAAIGLWTKTGELAISFGSTSNPLGELAAFGQNFIHMTQWCFTLVSGLYVVALGAKIFAGGAMVGLITSVASFLITLAVFFFLIGFVMAFIVPLYPFFRFFFGALTWLMSVFEAVVSMPLFALAHVNPYGEGISGDQAKYGYGVLTQILLRPVLMVLGLVAGFILFSVALIFLNEAFLIASKGTGSFSGSTALLSKLIYSVIYAAMVLIMANECFSLIGVFPQVALSWLGKSTIKEEGVDTKLVGTAAAYLSQQAASGFGGWAKNVGTSIKGMEDRRLGRGGGGDNGGGDGGGHLEPVRGVDAINEDGSARLTTPSGYGGGGSFGPPSLDGNDRDGVPDYSQSESDNLGSHGTPLSGGTEQDSFTPSYLQESQSVQDQQGQQRNIPALGSRSSSTGGRTTRSGGGRTDAQIKKDMSDDTGGTDKG
ncbi:MAG TPA: hypothetical protein DCY07_05040, partial [Rhodospirillaceae bacterium]|nr:hypothetical protein [Rhodospirillaceae bacterium]